MSKGVVERFLGRLTVVDGAVFGGLVVYPVLPTLRWRRGQRAPVLSPYVTLAEAIVSQQAEVTEAPSAHVPELVVKNAGPTMVLGLDGDELVGGRQNRCLNATVLLASESLTAVPVSCVEKRRWREEGGRHFRGGERMSHGLRQQSHGHVSLHLSHGVGHQSNQHAIWNEIASAHGRHGTHSPTASMHDLIEARHPELQRYVEAFPYYPNAIGMVVAVGERIVGADLFDRAETAEKYWSRLLRGYAQDVAGRIVGRLLTSHRRRAETFLVAAARGALTEFKSPGLGSDMRVSGNDGVSGSALAWDDHVIHLSLFGAEVSK